MTGQEYLYALVDLREACWTFLNVTGGSSTGISVDEREWPRGMSVIQDALVGIANQLAPINPLSFGKPYRYVPVGNYDDPPGTFEGSDANADL
jgi:hypothetical protein